MTAPTPIHEPHKIKTVRRTSFPTFDQRKKNLIAARFNMLHMKPSQVTFDMVSWGASAVSQEQLAGLLVGDEAYAGARNFEALQAAIHDVLGHKYVCPTHNLLGAIKLVVATMVPDGASFPSNAIIIRDALKPRGLASPDIRDHGEAVFTGNVDLKALEAEIAGGKDALIYVETFADAHHPVSLSNLKATRDVADEHGVPLVLDGSRIVENAWYIQRHETGQARALDRRHRQGDRLELPRPAGRRRPGSEEQRRRRSSPPTTSTIFEKFMNEVVVYEGLHTYGGMAGRTMEVLARGLREMTQRGRGALDDAPGRALHAAPPRRRRAARARLRRRLHPGGRVPPPRREAPQGHHLRRPLPHLRHPRGRPGHVEPGCHPPRPDPAAGHDQRAARPGGRRDHRPPPAARARSRRWSPRASAPGATRWRIAG